MVSFRSAWVVLAERPRSAAGGAGEPLNLEKPSCPAGLLVRLVRPLDADSGAALTEPIPEMVRQPYGDGVDLADRGLDIVLDTTEPDRLAVE